MLVPYADSDDFTAKLRKVLEEHGMAVVEGVLSADECISFEESWRQELTKESAQPRKEVSDQGWWINAWLHAQGETAWKARLHPRVRSCFDRMFGTSDLSCSMDTLKNFCVLEGQAATDNLEWLHVDQNTATGVTHPCYQGVLYIWPSEGAEKSTTVVWPGSHRKDGVYGCLVEDPLARERSSLVDQAGVPFGHYIQLGDLRGTAAPDLQKEALAGSRRVPVPRGALLLWDSCTTHQGWSGGPRLAVPVCWEPRGRVGEEARGRKLFMAAAGLPSTHSPSEGRFHPCVATRRGPSVRLRAPAVRPFGVLPPDALPAAEWEALWTAWEGEQHVEEIASRWEPPALERVLKPEIAALL